MQSIPLFFCFPYCFIQEIMELLRSRFSPYCLYESNPTVLRTITVRTTIALVLLVSYSIHYTNTNNYRKSRWNLWWAFIGTYRFIKHIFIFSTTMNTFPETHGSIKYLNHINTVWTRNDLPLVGNIFSEKV